MIYRIKAIQNITEKELKTALEALPAWRRAQTMRFKHFDKQKECAFSYLLLCEMLEERGIAAQPTFEYAENGKPSLKELPHLHFNLSHCDGAVACAINEHPVGIDIERTGRYSERLANYTMNADELAEIEAAEDRDLAFTRLWTMKEATMKLSGEGISTNVRKVLPHSYNIIIYNTTCYPEDGFVVTVAEWRKDAERRCRKKPCQS